MIARGLGSMDRGSSNKPLPIGVSTNQSIPSSPVDTIYSPPAPVSTNQAAAAVFASIGVPAVCQTINTNNQGGNFNQGVCTVAGSSQVYDAGLTTLLTPTQVATIVASGINANKGQSSPANPISSQGFSSPSNSVVGVTSSATPSGPGLVQQILNSLSSGSGVSVQPSVVQSSSRAGTTTNTSTTTTPTTDNSWLSSLFSFLSGNQTSSSSAPTLGPGISYNDINPDGTAVQSTSGGLLTNIFSILDQGISIAGVNVPLWLLGVTGYFGFKALSGMKQQQSVRGRA